MSYHVSVYSIHVSLFYVLLGGFVALSIRGVILVVYGIFHKNIFGGLSIDAHLWVILNIMLPQLSNPFWRQCFSCLEAQICANTIFSSLGYCISGPYNALLTIQIDSCFSLCSIVNIVDIASIDVERYNGRVQHDRGLASVGNQCKASFIWSKAYYGVHLMLFLSMDPFNDWIKRKAFSPIFGNKTPEKCEHSVETIYISIIIGSFGL